jgi:AcrR family transcriptional regulator
MPPRPAAAGHDAGHERAPRRAGAPKRADRVRKGDIVHAATPLFAERGYDGVSLSDVAERVGIRKASLFHHFSGKEDLYAAVLAALVSEVAGVLDLARLGSAPYPHRFDGLTRAITELLGRHRHVARLLIREALDDGPVMRGSLGDAVQAVLGLATEFAREGQRAGYVDPSLDARHIVMSMVGIHFLPFAIESVTRRYAGVSPFDAEYMDARVREVTRQARKLVRPDG